MGFAQAPPSQLDEETIRSAFDAFDADQSGKISVDELEAVVTKLGMYVKQDKLVSMVKAVDKDNDGQVDIKEFRDVIALAQLRGDGADGMAAIVHKKRTTGPPVKWESKKTGPGVSVSEEGDVVSRNGAEGYGVQLSSVLLGTTAEGWDKGTLIVECESVGEDSFIGVVGSNYVPGEWNQPLHTSRYGVVVELGKGLVHHKGTPTQQSIGPVKSGQRLHFEFDMVMREMVVDVLVAIDAEGKQFEQKRSVTIDELPHELCLAVCLGKGEQRVRIIGSSITRTGRNRSRRNSKDLWDDDNVVKMGGTPGGMRAAGSSGLEAAMAAIM